MAENSAEPEAVFGQRVRWDLGLDAGGSDSVERGARLVWTYGASGFTGAAFDIYGQHDSVRITADDVMAVGMLSIQIREQSAAGLRPISILALDSSAGRVTKLLAGVPADWDLHGRTESAFERWLGLGPPGDSLYRLLRYEASIPCVAAYKLMARKRLALFPIRDTVVEKALRQKADPWWRPWW